jgi:hypothetical protein
LYVGSALIVLVAFLLVRGGRRAAADIEEARRRLEAADERRARTQLNGRPPLEARGAQRYPPRPPRR